jgi:hypothetical protein
MFKKITAVCLTFILVISLAIIPAFASGSQSGTTIENQANIVSNDKKNKDDKDKQKDLLEVVMKKFLDSNEFEWAQKSIEKMGYMGILSGTGNGYFQPKNNVTHAEAIAMVLKLTGHQAEADAINVEPNFFKGKSDKWSYGYLQLALDKGIIIPKEDGSFNPKTPAKRHEIAKYVVRALGESKLALDNMKTKLNYTDASSIPAGSVGYVYAITKLGIMQGNKNEFQPNKPITRAELAIILDKAEGNNNGSGSTSNSLEGKFVEFDIDDLEITLKVNNEAVSYDVNENALVYKNSKYYRISSLVAGDIIRLVLDKQKEVIFIEFIKSGTVEPDENKLSIEKMSYSSLPEVIQDKVDELKDEENFAAFEYDEDIYLIATRGEKPTGGYAIDIEEVYKQIVDTDEYNLKAVVEITNPSSSIVTQSITHPYSIVKLDYFDDINKVNFVDSSDKLIEATTIKTINEEEVISGTVYSLDLSDEEITLAISTNVRRTYEIPDAAKITLNGVNADLSDLEVGMTVKITKANDVVITVAATSLEEVISGTVYSLDLSDEEVTLTISTNVHRTYVIPDAAVITLDGVHVNLSDVKVGMAAKITKINGEITKLVVTTTDEVINGSIYSLDVSDDEITLALSTNVRRTYEIPDGAVIKVDGVNADLTDLEVGMTAKITKFNGVITKLEATTLKEVISGTVYSLDLSDDEVTLTISTRVRRAYEIPNAAVIVVNDVNAELSDLEVGMEVEITKTNGVITKLVAED